MLKMVDGTGIIGVDMICPLGVSTPQPPNYDRVELEGAGMLVLPNSLDAPLERLELGGKTEQAQTSGKNLANPSEFVIGTLAGDAGNIINLKQYITTGYIPVIPGKRYSTSCGNKFLAHTITAYDKEKTKINYPMNMSSEMPEGAAYIRLSYKKIDMANVTESDMEELKKVCMVNEGSTVLPYEPYTGGKPSPSLEYEQEVKNAGKWNEGTQKYEVDVKVVGKNLFDVNYFAESENYQNKEGDATYWKYATFKVKPNTTYTVSKRKSLNVNGAINNGIYYGGALAFNNDVNSVKITTKDDGVFYVIFFYRSEDVNILKEMDIQIELGETLTEYEPYKEQTLTLTSDRPITKWDKLVEQGGQIGWLYQSSKMILDGTKIKWLHSNKPENSYFATTIIDAYGGKGASFCKTYRNIQDSAYVIKYANERCIYSDHPTYTSGDKFFRAPNENVTTLEQWKEFIDENPIEMLYHTKNSESVPLPQSEQNAIRALKAYYPTTVITADGGELDPDIKATYRKEI